MHHDASDDDDNDDDDEHEHADDGTGLFSSEFIKVMQSRPRD